MKRRWLGPALVLALATLALVVVWRGAQWQPPRADVVAANDLLHTVQARWDGLEASDLGSEFARVTVLDDTGTLVAATGEPVTSDRQGFLERAASYQVTVDGDRVGTLWIADDAWQVARERSDAIAGTATLAILAMAAAMLVLTWWLDRRILRPFRAAERFAVDVAAGNLDAPLAMDQGNILGAFTESLDLMRTELADARQREAHTRRATKDLVAELGHDIRTPLASVGATAEVLALTETDPARRAQLDVVLAKASQIGALVEDLLRASEDELTVMPVETSEVASSALAPMLHQAGHGVRLRVETLPECLVVVDLSRLQQTFDNVLVNASKYAGTEVVATGTLSAGLFQLRLRDFGPSLPTEELEAVLGKGVRGSTSGAQPGSGLGLYTAALLMERTGGSLHLEAADPGLAVVIELPLAR